ncbi:MAG: hypothetical protein OXQ29_07795 [Rhodospirillaceae bacterium]|nr:hypothetical protein [Rhodospirillaceae bacterium]
MGQVGSVLSRVARGGIVLVLASGLFRVALAQQIVPYFPAADTARQGFLRIVNDSARSGTVTIVAIDDAGLRYDPVTLTLEANESAHFNADDLEGGNTAKGLTGSTGHGSGDWRLHLTSDLDIEVAAYIRTADGFLSSIHDRVPIVDGEHRVITFNPGRNTNQVSRLRLINPGDLSARVRIKGIDDNGQSPGDIVEVSVPPGAVRSYTSAELESGTPGFGGALGTGSGKWQLFIASDRPIDVMSLLESPTGHITNLSTLPAIGVEDDGPLMKAAPGTEVSLRSVLALDCPGGASGYQWGQVSGPEVALSDERAEMPQFTVPEQANGSLTFRLAAECADSRLLDTVTIEAVPARDETVLSALVDFEDVNAADRPLTRGDLAGLLVENDDSLARYLAAASRGLLNVRFDVLDWVTVRKSRQQYPIGGGSVVSDIVDRLSRAANLADYDKVFPAIFPLEQGYPGCRAYLTPFRFDTVNGSYRLGAAWLSGRGMGCVRKGRSAHEFGHTFGFVHSLQLQCDNTSYGLPASSIDPNEWDSCHILNACANDDCSELKAGLSGFVANSDPDMLGGDHTSFYESYFPLVYHAVWQAHAGWLADRQIVTSPGSHWITSLESLSTTPKAIRIRLGRDHLGGVQDYWLETRQRVPKSDLDQGPEDACVVAARLAVPNLYGQRRFGDSGHTDTLRFWHSRQSPFGANEFLSVRQDEPFWDPYRGIRFSVTDCITRDEEVAVKVAVERSWLSVDPPVVATLPERSARVTVTNGGPRTVNVGQPSIEGRHPDVFSIEDDGCANVALGPGAACHIDLGATTTPLSVGFLRIPNDDDLAPELAVSLMTDPDDNAARAAASTFVPVDSHESNSE